MTFMELAKERYSVRKFSDKPIEKEKLDAILEAGRIAPTATTTNRIEYMSSRAQKHWRKSGASRVAPSMRRWC